MTDRSSDLVRRIRALEEELELEFARRRAEFAYRIDQGKVVFENEALRQHESIRQRLLSYIVGARPLVLLTAPVIYSIIIPFILLDIFVTIYQAICFPIYGIEKVRRNDHITFDRRHLSYLNGLEKLNCVYCSYGNGLLSFAREIAGRTEKHWCPIKHAKRMDGAHRYYSEFLEFGDAQGYQERRGSAD